MGIFIGQETNYREYFGYGSAIYFNIYSLYVYMK